MTDLHDPEYTKEDIDRDLARANLLRMRGDYKGAVEGVLSVLKRAPDEPDAHTLIADIYAEQGDLGQAAQWYELALDLNPESAADRRKLDAVRSRMEDREAAASKQIALPPERSLAWLPWATMALLALVVGIGAYLAGRSAVPTRAADVTRIPVTAPAEPEPVVKETPPNNPVPPISAEPSTGLEEDRSLAAALSPILPRDATLLSTFRDPGSGVVYVTLRAGSDRSDRVLAAEGGRAVLRADPNAVAARIRLERAGRAVYAATVDRGRLTATEAPGWSEQNPGEEVLASALLADEWSANGAAATPAPNPASGP